MMRLDILRKRHGEGWGWDRFLCSAELVWNVLIDRLFGRRGYESRRGRSGDGDLGP